MVDKMPIYGIMEEMFRVFLGEREVNDCSSIAIGSMVTSRFYAAMGVKK